MTSSYSSRCLRASKFWPSTAFCASAKLVVDAACFVALGAQDVQASGADDAFVFAVGVGLVAVEDLVPLVGGHSVFVARVVPDGAVRIVAGGLDFALRGAQWLSNSLLHALLFGHEFGVAAEEDISAAAGHVGGDGDHALAPRL